MRFGNFLMNLMALRTAEIYLHNGLLSGEIILHMHIYQLFGKPL